MVTAGRSLIGGSNKKIQLEVLSEGQGKKSSISKTSQPHWPPQVPLTNLRGSDLVPLACNYFSTIKIVDYLIIFRQLKLSTIQRVVEGNSGRQPLVGWPGKTDRSPGCCGVKGCGKKGLLVGWGCGAGRSPRRRRGPDAPNDPRTARRTASPRTR